MKNICERLLLEIIISVTDLETLFQRCSVKKVFCKKVAAWDSGTGVSCKFCEISKNIFSYRTPPVAAFFLVQTWYFYHENVKTVSSLCSHTFKASSQEVIFRSSHQRYSVKKAVLGSFIKFTGKHSCQSPFFNKVARLRPQACNFIKKETLTQVLSCEFCEISRNSFNYRTPLGDCFKILIHSEKMKAKYMKEVAWKTSFWAARNFITD